MIPGFDVLVRKVIENGAPIFPEAICITEAERMVALERGEKLESIERLKHTNKTKFYAQYNNDPLDEENLEFRREWFQVLPPERMRELDGIPALISVDPAFRTKQYNDFTGLVVTKTLGDNSVVVMEARALKLTPKSLVDEIFLTVKRYGFIDRVLVETVTSQIMLMDLLQAEMKKQNLFFSLQEVQPDTNETKAVRIRGLTTHYTNRRMYHAGSCYALEEQLLEFPRGAHDDVIDALAYQVKFWNPTHQAAPVQQIPHGSFAWWKKQTRKPMRVGGLFNDFKRNI